MKKKIIGMLVCMLLLATSIVTIVAGNQSKINMLNPSVRVDQIQGKIWNEDGVGGALLLNGYSHTIAQSFIPSISNLTMVSVKLVEENSFHFNASVKISIRSELTGRDLVSRIVRPSEIPDAEIDGGMEATIAEVPSVVIHTNLFVQPGETYYIVCELVNLGDDAEYYWLGTAEEDSYENGFVFINGSNGWEYHFGTDCCFVTFGGN
jgi:hypothetical protein